MFVKGRGGEVKGGAKDRGLVVKGLRPEGQSYRAMFVVGS
jgi:hypothetical protein